jgi:hypothetical protein
MLLVMAGTLSPTCAEPMKSQLGTWSSDSVRDVLARDLITELADMPSGTEYTPGADPHWSDRYPGW